MAELQLTIRTEPDPDGHDPALELQGDWLIVDLTDGTYVGSGEASHSKDDNACAMCLAELHSTHISNLDPTRQYIQKLERIDFANPANFVEATAVSALNQALYSLAAQRQSKSIWKLFTMNPCRTTVPCYATINRALTSRDIEDHIAAATCAVDQGFRAIKCAPFAAVRHDGDRAEQAQEGLDILRAMRAEFPDLSILVDFQKRFTIDSLRMILQDVHKIRPAWIEEPIPLSPDYERVRKMTHMHIAAGELMFGWNGFKGPVSTECIDTIMPDVKHVGGLGPLLNVCQQAGRKVEVAPHNPSGPVASIATLHAAAVAPNISCIELPLIRDSERAYYLEWLQDGKLAIPGT